MPQTRAKTASSQGLIGCTRYPGPLVPLERMSLQVALDTNVLVLGALTCCTKVTSPAAPQPSLARGFDAAARRRS